MEGEENEDARSTGDEADELKDDTGSDCSWSGDGCCCIVLDDILISVDVDLDKSEFEFKCEFVAGDCGLDLLLVVEISTFDAECDRAVRNLLSLSGFIKKMMDWGAEGKGGGEDGKGMHKGVLGALYGEWGNDGEVTGRQIWARKWGDVIMITLNMYSLLDK